MQGARCRCSRFALAALATIVFITAAVPADAQTGAASITGIVSDDTGAAMQDVIVVATNEATFVTYSAVSNAAGVYTLTSLPVGTYVVSSDLTGFKPVVTSPMAVEANQIARLDLRLQLGAVEDVVEVVGASPLLKTENATVGEIISGTTATTLPLNGRNTNQLTLLLSGVVTPNPASFTALRNFGSGRPYVNGHREQANNYTLDGIDMNESIDNLLPYQPSPDALAEISVETNNYSAEIGNVGGAVINNVLKSGANDLRGNLFEFYRDSRFDANSWAGNRSAAPKPERTQHIFGGTLGGPIVRNRIFFFGDYQGTRLDEPGSGLASVAPDEWRRGDFSGVTGITIVDPFTGQPFPGNRIPEGRINPVARAILGNTALYPLPNRSVSGVTNNYVGRRLVTTRAYQWDAKVDAKLSTNDWFFVRYSREEYKSAPEHETIPLFLGQRNEAPTRNLAANWNRVLGLSMVNEVLAGYNEVRIVRAFDDLAGLGNANARFGIPGDQPMAGLSSISFASGLSNIGNFASAWDTLNRTYQLNERVTWMRGRHTVKLGGQLLHLSQQRYYAGNNGALGLFSYTGAFTNFGFADFLLDQVSAKGRGSIAAPWTHVHDRIALFAQNDLKVTRRLTANLGLRWAYTSPLVEKDDRQANFDLSTGRHLLAGRDGNSRALYEPYYKGFEPRLGFAWTAADRFVFRGAYGIVQFMEGTGANLRLPMNPPFFFESDVRYDRTTGAGSIQTGFDGLQPLDQPSGQVRAWDPGVRPQFTQQWNVFIEYLLRGSTSLSVGYVGHHADNLVTPVEGNQPLPGTGPVETWLPLQQRRPLYESAPAITNISTTASRGRSNYRALQSSLRQRLADGLEFLASYTLSEAMTNNLGYYGSPGVSASNVYWQNAYDGESEYGPAFFDATHNFVFSGTYEIPFGHERRWGADLSPAVDALFGGWSVSGIFQKRSGFPITVIDSRGSSLQGTRGFERPNRIGSGAVANPTIDRWIDIAAFERAAPGTWGDSGVGILRAPGYMNLDVAFGKRFPFGTRRSVQIRVEAFNALNEPSWGPPGRQLDSPNTFGVITSTVNAPRTIELVGKISF
jgi:hypothetical protein